MAKLTIIFENGEIKKELLFRDEVLGFTMKIFEFGMKSDKPCILNQFEDKFGCIDSEGELAEHLENLDFGDEDEILAAINYLSEIE